LHKFEGAIFMKQLLPFLTAMGLVLSVGLAYGEDMRSIVQDDGIMYAALYNSVTFVGSVDMGIQCFGAAVGGVVAEPRELRSIVQDDDLMYIAFDNSVTFVSDSLGPKCSWERGRGGESELRNAVTTPGGNN